MNALEQFLRNTTGVRLPVLSFFLRTLRPDIFATIDVHVLSALQKLGFKGIKMLPSGIVSKENYLEQDVVEFYLSYNDLLTEIGKHYEIVVNNQKRYMWPAEVDMALYMYDKLYPNIKHAEKSTKTSKKVEEKINQFLAIIDELVDGAYEVAKQPWAKNNQLSDMIISSANKLRRIMYAYAKEGKLKQMLEYYKSTLNDPTGRKVGHILREAGKKRLETEYQRIRKIVEDL